MKTSNLIKLTSVLLFYFFLFVSCTENQTILGEDSPTPTLLSAERTSFGSLYPSLLEGQACGAPYFGHLQRIVVSGCVTNYDRTVIVTILHGNAIIEQKTLTILANHSISNSLRVFHFATENYGSVRLEIETVLDENNLTDTSCNWVDLNPAVNNCYTPELPDIDPCFGSDEDSDGECDWHEIQEIEE